MGRLHSPCVKRSFAHSTATPVRGNHRTSTHRAVMATAKDHCPSLDEAVARLRELARDMPTKSPRSKLAPFEGPIIELIDKQRTYREICELLGTVLGAAPSTSTLHHFVQGAQKRCAKRRAATKQAAAMNPGATSSMSKPESMAVHRKEHSQESSGTNRPPKLRPASPSKRSDATPFHFEPSQPLQLIPTT